MKKLMLMSIGLLLLTFSAPGQAEEQGDVAAAKEAYQRHCASCHGVEGKGNGPIANTLKYLPTDLTQLSKNNDGEFPRQRVYDAIDGKTEVRSHGPRDMPVWGAKFKSEVSAGDTVGAGYARTNIMMLTNYLVSIQEK
jgi:mono/diheme cytochrome c family protein